MLTKQVTASITNNYRLVNFCVKCVCGKEYTFTSLHQTEQCSCGHLVCLSTKLKDILIKDGSAKPIN
jgi:hypothetical protein